LVGRRGHAIFSLFVCSSATANGISQDQYHFRSRRAVFSSEPRSNEAALYRMGGQCLDRMLAWIKWKLQNRSSDPICIEAHSPYFDPRFATEGRVRRGPSRVSAVFWSTEIRLCESLSGASFTQNRFTQLEDSQSRQSGAIRLRTQ